MDYEMNKDLIFQKIFLFPQPLESCSQNYNMRSGDCKYSRKPSKVLESLECNQAEDTPCDRCRYPKNRTCAMVIPDLVPLATEALQAHQAYLMACNDEDTPDIIHAANGKLRTTQQAFKNKRGGWARNEVTASRKAAAEILETSKCLLCKSDGHWKSEENN
ncbi:hypothetical protein H112_07300 [Trichophyton rubrum D6]|nr:hypothetical protein H100_07327 [Trichophyton rubrum MR850]EZF38495.1 hypothetical protein H102_07288 [Trichophyton rubrum CBS 100081]EZF49190.1 hypothetical protein H103_07310 [Trichophyton rubrum CBS 288.86]EZF59835.1 hypothetical protein H104_07263 [Trichophyton rubrum CBS 289.86]EZF70261.1 hypothetical protein H105_07326 [Trichophyton soudanense CBS 452.61]EZF81036.1 hypothetical protein H110_07309 [Trichophyton rubrum MR1448]EZF91876.1 hypothetical protein H113_07362 [Trichophyton rub